MARSRTRRPAPRGAGHAPPTTPPPARAQALALGPLGGLDPLVELDDPGILSRAALDLPAKTTAAAGAPPITEACEPSSATASRSSFSRCENTTRAAVVAGDDAEDDRAAEVHHRPADLRAVLELPAGHRLGRAEAREVGEDHDRTAAAGGVDRPRDLARGRGKSCPRSTARGRRPATAVAGKGPRLDAENRGPASRPGGRPTPRRTQPRANRPSARAADGRGRLWPPSPSGCRTAACARVRLCPRRSHPPRGGPTRVPRGELPTSRPIGSEVRRARKRSPGAT